MRRYQVMIESAFPSEAGTMLKNLEKKGNPWGLAKKQRLEWLKELDFEVPVVGKDIEDLTEVEYLYWVGCAGALEDALAKKTAKAFAELLHIAGVKFAIMGGDEKCTGDSARRLGNEPLFQELGMENVMSLNAAFGEEMDEDGKVVPESAKPKSAKKIVATCPHCPHCHNTLGNEYPQLGGDYQGRPPHPAAPAPGGRGQAGPGHPGRGHHHLPRRPATWAATNKIYTRPREIIAAVPGVRNEEMHRHKERGFCCGAGGARMWMEERIGKRINNERVDEALSVNPDIVSTACPLLPGDADRLGQRQEERRQGQGVHPGRRRRPAPAGLRQDPGRPHRRAGAGERADAGTGEVADAHAHDRHPRAPCGPGGVAVCRTRA
ncbi:hypothetical protein STENM327S_04958 [Streptomyces tendae]